MDTDVRSLAEASGSRGTRNPRVQRGPTDHRVPNVTHARRRRAGGTFGGISDQNANHDLPRRRRVQVWVPRDPPAAPPGGPVAALLPAARRGGAGAGPPPPGGPRGGPPRPALPRPAAGNPHPPLAAGADRLRDLAPRPGPPQLRAGADRSRRL